MSDAMTLEKTEAPAADGCTPAEPQAEHKWLHSLVGEWTYESEMLMGPDQPPIKCSGTQSTRSLGGLWILCEGTGEMPDGNSASMIITIGYDPQKARYVGTFIASMMTKLWIYEGDVDASGKILTLNAEGPSFADPTVMAQYQDVVEVVDNDHYIFKSRVQGGDGAWNEFMTAHYRRLA